MSQLDEKIKMYVDNAAELGLSLSTELLTAVTKGLGPSIYSADASLVSGSDPDELDRVKKNFLIGKLGLADGPALDEAIKEAIAAMGTGNRQKHRAIFYALLVKKFGKESIYN